MKMKKLVSAFSALAMAVTAMAGLAVTANAAEIAFQQDFTANVEGSTDPADYGFTKLSETDSSVTSVTNGVFTNTAGNAGSNKSAEYVANFTEVGAGNTITVKYTWSTGNATGNNTASYATTYLADNGGNKIFELRYNGQPDELYLNDVKIANPGRNGTYEVTATIDMNTRKIMSLSVGSVYSLTGTMEFMSSNASGVAQFGFRHQARASSWSNTASVDNIYISYETAKVPVKSVAVQYVTEDGTVIKTENLDNIYTTGDETVLKTVDSCYVGDNVYIPFRKYILENGNLYEVEKNDGTYYGENTYLNAETVLQKTVSVVAPEGENKYIALVDADGDSGNLATVRASNMSAARGNIILGEVEPGVYTITYNQYIRGGNPDLYLNGVFVCDLEMHEGSWAEASTENITITEPGTLEIRNIDMTDYILLIKTGEIEQPEATEATSVDVPDATGVKAFKVESFALNNTAPKWTITATPAVGEAQIQTVDAIIPNVEAENASLGLIVDGVPEDVTVSATLGY